MHGNLKKAFLLHAKVKHEPNPAIILAIIDFSEAFQIDFC